MVVPALELLFFCKVFVAIGFDELAMGEVGTPLITCEPLNAHFFPLAILTLLSAHNLNANGTACLGVLVRQLPCQ